jgi:hypothetical protein
MNLPVTDPWLDRLSEYVDGDLDAPTRAALEAHLATCADCRATRDELERVVARAKRVANRAPASDLWTPIEAAIAAQRDRSLPVGRPPRVISFTLGRLVAAAAVVAVIAGSVTWTIATRRGPVAIADGRRVDSTPSVVGGPPTTDATALAVASYRDAAADLERVLDAGRTTLRPETMRVIEENLRSIDLAIAQADSALRRDPGSAYLNQHLAATMQRKLKLLRRAVEITTTRS